MRMTSNTTHFARFLEPTHDLRGTRAAHQCGCAAFAANAGCTKAAQSEFEFRSQVRGVALGVHEAYMLVCASGGGGNPAAHQRSRSTAPSTTCSCVTDGRPSKFESILHINQQHAFVCIRNLQRASYVQPVPLITDPQHARSIDTHAFSSRESTSSTFLLCCPLKR